MSDEKVTAPPAADVPKPTGRMLVERLYRHGVVAQGDLIEAIEAAIAAARAEGESTAIETLRNPPGLMIGHVARQHRCEQDALGYMRRAADWIAANKSTPRKG